MAERAACLHSSFYSSEVMLSAGGSGKSKGTESSDLTKIPDQEKTWLECTDVRMGRGDEMGHVLALGRGLAQLLQSSLHIFILSTHRQHFVF